MSIGSDIAACAAAIALASGACGFDPTGTVLSRPVDASQPDVGAGAVDSSEPDGSEPLPDGGYGEPTAAPAIASFTSASFDSAGDDVVGFRFIVDKPVTVTQLGFFDRNDNGLVEAHEVGIFDTSSKELLSMATVPGGQVAQLDGHWRYVDIEPLALEAGATFVVLGYRESGGGDGIAFNVSNLATASWIQFVTEVAENDTGGLAFVDSPFGQDNGWFGPNFKAILNP